jgi:hypothetical protein
MFLESTTWGELVFQRHALFYGGAHQKDDLNSTITLILGTRFEL